MASQPGVHNEERNRLRLRAWEQRNQETSQTKELSCDKVPLFGEPYKTNKGDELSSRIKRMLGSYEDVSGPSPFSIESLPIPAFSQSDHALPSSDQSTKPPFHNQVVHMSSESQNGQPDTTSYSSQSTRTSSTASFSPNPSSNFSNSSLKQCRNGQLDLSVHQIKKEDFSDLKETSASSPDIKPPPFLHSCEHSATDIDSKETFDRPNLQGSASHPTESVSSVDASTLDIKQSPKDVPVCQANKTSTLPSQTFPPLLSSKQPSVVMTQKPTAYVRPMDGQDQVVSESPELKPSPEPHVPVTELIDNSDLSKTKVKPQFFETRTDEVQCVEDILREMTHSWPPLLTALHTPHTDEPSKLLFQAKEAERVSSCPGQKNSSSSTSSKLNPQSSSSGSFEEAHSRRRESVSSSDSDSSSGSESESESTAEEPRQPSVCSSAKANPEAPALGHSDWQLGKWIRSSQQSASTEAQGGARASESPAHKQLLPTQSSKHSGRELNEPIRESEPQLSSRQKDSTENLSVSQQHSESCCPHGGLKRSSADVNGRSSSKKLSKTKRAECPDPAEGARCAKAEEVVASQTKDSRFTDKPKVKTKDGFAKRGKVKAETEKKDVKRTKETSLEGQTAQSEPFSLHAQCPSCSVRNPERCSCPPSCPAQPEPPSPDPPERTRHGKAQTTAVCHKGIKTSRGKSHKHLKTSRHSAKASPDARRPPRRLLVKIDLSLLSKVPQGPGTALQWTPSKAKTSALVREQEPADASAARKPARNKKKKHDVDVGNNVLPRKKQKLENDNTSTAVSVKLESSRNQADAQETKRAKKTAKDKTKDSKLHKNLLGKTQVSSGEAARSKDKRNKEKRKEKSSEKNTERPRGEKQKPAKRSVVVSSQHIREPLTKRPLLKAEERHYPVKHFIKEAKRLKHKADAESDKLSKAFNYLDAAMFFVESGIAMEKDPQISMSSYTMFAETVELLKFVLKLRNPADASSTPSAGNDFLALCLKCQSLLQMSMFHHKYKTALKYSKTLAEHFSNSAQASHNPPASSANISDHPSPNVPSPANTSGGGGGQLAGPAGSSVAVPQAIEQMVITYVNITTLVLSAHDIWEQAEELAQRGSGLLAELDSALGPLSLSASMSSMVRYARQGVHWLRSDTHKL